MGLDAVAPGPVVTRILGVAAAASILRVLYSLRHKQLRTVPEACTECAEEGEEAARLFEAGRVTAMGKRKLGGGGGGDGAYGAPTAWLRAVRATGSVARGG